MMLVCGIWQTTISTIANEVDFSYRLAQVVLTGLRMRWVCVKFHDFLLMIKGSAGSAAVLGGKTNHIHSAVTLIIRPHTM
jgi:hypothetical protein